MKYEIKYLKRLTPKGGTAIVGSPGLRSVGSIAIDHLIEKLELDAFAELYSPSFPISYDGIPYAGSPGEAGCEVEEGVVGMPKVRFYLWDDLVVTRGYQAELHGQYGVARKVVELYSEWGVDKMFTLGGYVPLSKAPNEPLDMRKVSYCATYTGAIKSGEMEKLDIEKKEVGPFLGFTALVMGLGMMKGIKGIALFGETLPNYEDPLDLDPKAAEALLGKLSQILGTEIDTNGLVKEVAPEESPAYYV